MKENKFNAKKEQGYNKKETSNSEKETNELKQDIDIHKVMSELNQDIKQNKTATIHAHKKAHKEKNQGPSKLIIALLTIAAIIILFNQIQISQLSASDSINSRDYGTGSVDLSAVDIGSIKSTAQTVATVFPVKEWKNSDDAFAALFPTGTPSYGEDLGVSFDTPVKSLADLSKMYRSLKQEVQTKDPEAWQRFLNLALKPVGISCEFCCGVGPIGITKRGDAACGCQHDSAVLSVALYLTAYTDYSDGQILQEVMKWKTLFFPKNMVELGTSLAGGDTSALKQLPGMVGGC